MSWCPQCGNDWDGSCCDNCKYAAIPENLKQKTSTITSEQEQKDITLSNDYQSPISSKNTSPAAGFMGTILGIVLGFIGMSLGVAIWLIVAIHMKLEVGFIALAIGYFAAIGIVKGVKIIQGAEYSISKPLLYGILAALLGILGVYLSKVIYISIMLSGDPKVGLIEAILTGIIGGIPIIGPSLIGDKSGMFYDLLYYGLAIWIGFEQAYKGLLPAHMVQTETAPK